MVFLGSMLQERGLFGYRMSLLLGYDNSSVVTRDNTPL